MSEANDRFEAAAARFYKDTGVLAPGKDNPFVLDVYDLRVKLFAEWRARQLLLDAIAGIKAAADLSDESGLPLLEDLDTAICHAMAFVDMSKALTSGTNANTGDE